MVGAWTLRRKMEAKRKKRAENANYSSPSILGDTTYRKVLPSVTTSEPERSGSKGDRKKQSTLH